MKSYNIIRDKIIEVLEDDYEKNKDFLYYGIPFNDILEHLRQNNLYKSPNTIRYHLRQLIKRGDIGKYPISYVYANCRERCSYSLCLTKDKNNNCPYKIASPRIKETLKTGRYNTMIYFYPSSSYLEKIIKKYSKNINNLRNTIKIYILLELRKTSNYKYPGIPKKILKHILEKRLNRTFGERVFYLAIKELMKDDIIDSYSFKDIKKYCAYICRRFKKCYLGHTTRCERNVVAPVIIEYSKILKSENFKIVRLKLK